VGDHKGATVKKRHAFVAVAICLLILAVTCFHVKVGRLMFGREDLHRKRIGYCFDLVTDRAGSRLFVAAGNRGLHRFDLDQGQLRYAGTYYDDGYYRNLKAWKNRVYVADTRRGLVVLDLASELPTTTWIQSNSTAYGLHLEQDLAFVAAYEHGLQIFDISEPDSPALIGSLETPGYAWDVWVNGRFAYIADFDEGLTIVDVSSPSAPRYVTTVTWTRRYQSAEIVRGEGTIAYVGAADHGLIIIDISDPLHPVVAAKYRPLRIGAAEGLAVRDDIVYLAMGSQIEIRRSQDDLEIATTQENGLHVVDVTDPYRPSLLGKISFLGWVEGVHLARNYVYVANTGTGVRSMDIRKPKQPVLVDAWNGLP
jgi:hypothetical protein